MKIFIKDLIRQILFILSSWIMIRVTSWLFWEDFGNVLGNVQRNILINYSLSLILALIINLYYLQNYHNLSFNCFIAHISAILSSSFIIFCLHQQSYISIVFFNINYPLYLQLNILSAMYCIIYSFFFFIIKDKFHELEQMSQMGKFIINILMLFSILYFLIVMTILIRNEIFQISYLSIIIYLSISFGSIVLFLYSITNSKKVDNLFNKEYRSAISTIFKRILKINDEG